MKRFKLEYILFFAALLLYGATSSLHPFPDQYHGSTMSSAQLLMSHAWIYEFQLHPHPVWGMLTGLLGRLPLPLAATMNLFSVLCGAFSVMLFYRLLRNCKLDSDYDERTPSARTMLGAAGSVYLMVLLPIWISCNRAHYASFELLLFIIALLTTQNYGRRGGLHRLAGVGLLFGLGIIESATFLVSAPLIGLYIVFLMWRNSNIKTSSIAIAAGSFLAGLALPLIPAWLYTTLPVYEWGGARNFWHSAWLTYSSSAKTLRAQLGQTGWIILLMVSIMPFIGGMWIKRCQPVENRSKSVPFMALILVLLAGALLYNVTIAPWVLLPQTIAFPLPPLLIAASFGMAIGFWTAYFKDRRRGRHHRRQTAPSGGRRTEIAISILLAALAVAAIVVNFEKTTPKMNSEFDKLAESVIDGLSPRDTLFTTGRLDPHLALTAFDKGIDIALVNPRMASHTLYRNYLKSLMKSKRAESLIDINIETAIKEWMLADRAVTERIGFLGSPTWWERANYIPLNLHGVYYGVEPKQKPDLEALFKSEQPYWNHVKRNFAVSADSRDDSAAIVDSIGQMLARGINDFGVFMENFERPDLAREAYTAALEIHPGNLSANINLYSCLPEDDPTRADIMKRSEQIMRDLPQVSLRQIMLNHGYIRRNDSAKILRDIATGIVAESKPESAEMPETTPPEDIENFRELVEMIKNKQWPQAERRCRELIASNPNYDKVWLMLGIVAHQQGKHAVVDECLARMIETKKFWPNLVSIAAMSAKERGNLKRARQLYELVFRTNPENPKLLEELLRIDKRLGDTERSEIYLSKLIEIDSDNYLANFLLGSKLYEEGKYELALSAYGKCLEQARTFALLNNMAWIYNKLERHREALEMAEESLELNDNIASAWDTLGAILIETGKFERAEQALRRALELDPNSISAKISMVELLYLTGRKKPAQELAIEIESQQSDLSFEHRERLAEILDD